MRNFGKVATLVVGSGLLTLLYLCIPPLPSPKLLANHSYSSLIEQLGTPDESHPEKYIMWSVSRFGFNWAIEISYTRDPNSIPRYVDRHLSVGPYFHPYFTVMRQVAYASNQGSPPAP